MISIILLVLAMLVILLSYPAKKYNDKLLSRNIITLNQWCKYDIRIGLYTFILTLILCLIAGLTY